MDRVDRERLFNRMLMDGGLNNEPLEVVQKLRFAFLAGIGQPMDSASFRKSLDMLKQQKPAVPQLSAGPCC